MADFFPATSDVTTIFVCVTCRRGEEALGSREERTGFKFHAALAAAGAGLGYRIEPVECLLNCTRGCNVALRAEAKWTYHFGDLDPETQIGDVLAVAALHAASPVGEVPWGSRPEPIKRKAVSRIPPLPTSKG